MNDADIIRDFLLESYENLDQLDRDFVALEKDPTDRQRLASIFRTIHTIKGTCGFLGFARLEAVTHAGETLLSHLRAGEVVLTPRIASTLLALVDAVRAILDRIEKSGSEGDVDYANLIAALDAVLHAPTMQSGQEKAPPPIETTEAATDEAPAPSASDCLTSVAESSVRVDVGLLDRLMNLVGELVLARNQMLQCRSGRGDAILQGTIQRLNLITTELQEGVMKTRLQPISTIWNKYPRVVRDLALTCGKLVRLDLEGKETELDRSIVEAIKDPLSHLLRNAVDHGIESAEERRRNGRSAEGRLLLRAFHESGQVHIELCDDGAGLDLGRIRAKAVERGVLTADQVARLSDREVTQVVFLPGFSTADRITNVSGRGVGMDVVRTNIERIGGTVDLVTQRGQGTTVKIKIPLTLAIIPALIVTAGRDRYAIPQVSLVELVRLEGAEARRGIEYVHATPVHRLRGNLLPLVHLDHQLQVEPKASDDAVNIVVLQADQRPFGLVVDRIIDTEEIVVKPLSKLLKGIPLYAGATILGDGRVALILDVLGLAQTARVVSEQRRPQLGSAESGPRQPADQRQALLLFGIGGDRRMALPLADVSRLEEVRASAVERTAHREVVQHRGQIIPLLRLGQWFGENAAGPQSKTLQLVVCAREGRPLGLVVDRIHDVVETTIVVDAASRGPGTFGSAVIQDRVTDLLDLNGILQAADADRPGLGGRA